MPLHIGTHLDKILRDTQTGDRASLDLPRARIEIAVSISDPTQGFFSLDVEGFSAEEGRSLRAQFDAALSAWVEIGQLWEAHQKEAASKDHTPEGREVARALAVSDSRFVLANEKASEALGRACEQVLARGIVGWPEGEFSCDGADGSRQVLGPEFRTESGPLGSRRVLLPHLVALIGGGLRAVNITRQIFAVSRGDKPETALEQWASAQARIKKAQAKDGTEHAQEAPKSSPPFVGSPSSQPPPKRSRSGKKSQSPSDSGAASPLAQTASPACTGSEPTTAPPAESETPTEAKPSEPVEGADSTGELLALAAQ